MKTGIGVLALTLATPASAQAPSVSSPVAQTPASPIASEVAAKLFPDGTYRKLLGPSMAQMMGGMTDSYGAMPIGPFLRAAGLPEGDAAKLDRATIGEVMAIIDPAYRQRMRGLMDGVFAAMIPLFEQLEPDLRAGLATSLDNRFSPAQLGELRTFFTTPTGQSFASQQMLLFMDPAVMGRMQTALPKIMTEMPKLMEQAAKANEGLPKPKTIKDLTPAEREKLARLIGVDPESLKP